MKNFLSRISLLSYNTSWAILVFFTFVLPLKFGLPYISNVIHHSPTLDVSNLKNFISEWIYDVWPNHIALMLVVLAFLFLMFAKVLKNEMNFVITKIDFVFLLFLLCSIPSVFLSPSIKISLDYFLLFSCFYLYYFMLNQHIIDSKKRRAIFFIFFISFIFVVLFGLYQYFYQLEDTLKYVKAEAPHLLNDPSFRSRLMSKKIFSTFNYSNTFAGYLILTIPVVTGILATKNKKILKWFIVSLLVILIGSYIYLITLERQHLVGHAFLWACIYPISGLFMLIKTKSEGAIIAFASAIIISAFVFIFKRKKYLLNLFLVLFIFVTAFFTYRIIKPEERVKMEEKMVKSFVVRKEYYEAALSMLEDTRFYGSGLGTFGILYSQYKLPNAEEVQMAHNVFLQLLVECGFAGGILFIIFFLLVIVHALRIKQSPEKKKIEDIPVNGFIFFTALTASFFHNMIDFEFYVPSFGFTFMLLAALIINFGKEKNDEKKEKAIKTGKLGYVLNVIFLVITIFTVSFIIKYLSGSIRAFQHYRTANAHYSLGRIEQVVDEMKFAIDLDPLNDLYYYEMARKLFSANDFQGAEYFYMKAVRLSPLKPYYHHEYGRAMFKNDIANNYPLRKEKILKEFNEAIRLYPEKKFYKKELEDVSSFFERSKK